MMNRELIKEWTGDLRRAEQKRRLDIIRKVNRNSPCNPPRVEKIMSIPLALTFSTAGCVIGFLIGWCL